MRWLTMENLTLIFSNQQTAWHLVTVSCTWTGSHSVFWAAPCTTFAFRSSIGLTGWGRWRLAVWTLWKRTSLCTLEMYIIVHSGDIRNCALWRRTSLFTLEIYIIVHSGDISLYTLETYIIVHFGDAHHCAPWRNTSYSLETCITHHGDICHYTLWSSGSQPVGRDPNWGRLTICLGSPDLY